MAVTVVLTGGSYPESSDIGTPITGVEAAEAEGALVFHGGTALYNGHLTTNGGRIPSVTAPGNTAAEAREQAYAAAGKIEFEGVRFRADIGAATQS